MVRKRKFGFCFLWILFVLASVSDGFAAEVPVHVKWVVDGDTLILQDGRHVRYIGVDAPEIDHQHTQNTPLANTARTVNQTLVDAYPLELVLDQQQKDHYGRTLAYVYRSDGVFVNLEMIRSGNAWCLFIPPNTLHAQLLLDAQHQAMTKGEGIWRSFGQDEKSPGAYVGNRRSKRFHHSSCPDGKKISKTNKVLFQCQWDAFWEGFAPHKECAAFP
ncbi:thermonuclease family protein [Desulfosarcina sp. OttesenSCG-928-A07]|nr:thermonuclease family protein [Desulfosarcina sp. OttesenSCG-928-A07]